jgi:hypothetical protein
MTRLENSRMSRVEKRVTQSSTMVRMCYLRKQKSVQISQRVRYLSRGTAASNPKWNLDEITKWVDRHHSRPGMPLCRQGVPRFPMESVRIHSIQNSFNEISGFVREHRFFRPRLLGLSLQGSLSLAMCTASAFNLAR